MLGLTSSEKCMKTWLVETSPFNLNRDGEMNTMLINHYRSVGRSNQTTKQRKWTTIFTNESDWMVVGWNRNLERIKLIQNIWIKINKVYHDLITNPNTNIKPRSNSNSPPHLKPSNEVKVRGKIVPQSPPHKTPKVGKKHWTTT